ncbi:hypothetical protein Tco_1160655 [Tanacetum coccineum]
MIIKFRLGGHAYNLTLLEFARRLGLYQAVELEEEGFNVYFERAWVIARWMKRKGAGTQKESQICCGQFIAKLARKCRVLTDVMNLYDRMGRIEIRQEAIKQMEYMQSYHWDRYQGVFKHIVGVYRVPMQGTYNPPGYAQP